MTGGGARALSRRGATRRAAALAIAAAALSLSVVGCGESGYRYVFRYRLAFSVMVDDTLKSGESVIETTYYGSNTVGASGTSSYSFSRGVAPIIDLGRYGMLAAAMHFNSKEYMRRKKREGLTCKMPSALEDFPAAFGVNLKTLAAMRSGKRELPERLYPAFVWFPVGASYQEAQQLCHEEFSRVIGPTVKLVSMTIEVTPDAPLLKRLPIQAEWLEKLRIDQKNLYIGSADRFVVQRQGQLETDTF